MTEAFPGALVTCGYGVVVVCKFWLRSSGEELHTNLNVQLSAKVVAARCIRTQQTHLRAFSRSFSDLVNANFARAQPQLLQSFLTLVSGMEVQVNVFSTSACFFSALLEALPLSLPSSLVSEDYSLAVKKTLAYQLCTEASFSRLPISLSQHKL